MGGVRDVVNVVGFSDKWLRDQPARRVVKGKLVYVRCIKDNKRWKTEERGGLTGVVNMMVLGLVARKNSAHSL